MEDGAQIALQNDNAFQASPSHNRLYNCLVCTKNFSSCEDLALHVQTHASVLNMAALCGGNTPKVASCATRSTSNDCIRTFNCLICTEKFSSCTDLTKHLHSHAGLEKFGCKLRVCAQNRPNSIFHSKFYPIIGNSSTKTKVAFTESTTKQESHIDNKELEEISTGTSKLDMISSIHKRKLFCKTCGESFEDIGVFLLHIKAHAGTKISKNNTFTKAVWHNGDSTNLEIDKKSSMHETFTEIPSERGKFGFYKPTSSSEEEISCKSASKENLRIKQTSFKKENMSDNEVFGNDDDSLLHTDTYRSTNDTENGSIIKGRHQWSMQSQSQVDKENENDSFQHNVVTHGIKEFVCGICHRLFANNADFSLHMKSHDGFKIYDCLICGKPFPCWEDLTLHLSSHTDSTKFDCEICSKTFFSSEDIMYHMDTHMKDDVGSSICEFCGKEFSRRSDVIQHMSVHTGIKNFICKTCGKSFTRRHSLTRHMYTHTAIETFICQICGKGFSKKCDLTSHLDTHSGVTRYKCGICNEPFTSTVHLSSHMYIHGDLKSYGCVTCGKAFIRLPDLKRHLIIHSRIKKYKCEICSVYFSHKSNWRRHEKNHH